MENGVRVPLTTRHRKYAELDGDVPREFGTPSGKISDHAGLPLTWDSGPAGAQPRAWARDGLGTAGR